MRSITELTDKEMELIRWKHLARTLWAGLSDLREGDEYPDVFARAIMEHAAMSYPELVEQINKPTESYYEV